MTTQALFPKFLPWLYGIILALLAYLLHFNGLYGQDAHEYLRLSQVFFDRLQGLPVPAPGIGDEEFAGGYPLAGALLRFCTGDAVLALQVLSILSAALGVWMFERILTLLSPGARMESRWVFVGLGLLVSPMFFRSGMMSMSDGMGLMLALSTFYFAFRAFENSGNTDAIWAAVFAALAISTRYALAVLLLPLGVALLYYWLDRKKWLPLLAATGAFALAFLPHIWLQSGIGVENLLDHSMLKHWSPAHFFQSSFQNANGLSQYTLPNVLFLLFPLAHPAFCVALPGLLFLSKKTDLVLPTKKILLACIIVYLLLLGGIPHQNLRHLLPAYALLLFLFFPAWDRLYCYGFLFFRRITLGVLGVALFLQILFCVQYLAPSLRRNQLEQAAAAQLKAVLPPNAIVYAFDLDMALHSYLPELQFRNLWEQRYANFPSGSYVLFNESLRTQWAGQNPVLNWDDLKSNYSLQWRADLPEGWILMEIE